VSTLYNPAIQLTTTAHHYQSRYIPATYYKFVPALARTLQIRAPVWDLTPVPYKLAALVWGLTPVPYKGKVVLVHVRKENRSRHYNSIGKK
jgi:hypothetical protein